MTWPSIRGAAALPVRSVPAALAVGADGTACARPAPAASKRAELREVLAAL